MPGLLLLLLYLATTLAPIGVSWALGWPPRPFLDDLSSGLAMTAFAALMIEFLLTGRIRAVSNDLGIDITMRFHQYFARTALVLVLLHPFLYTLPIPVRAPPWDPTAAGYLGLDGYSLLTGGAAWVLLGALVLTGVARGTLPLSYEVWRIGHALGAVLVAGFGALHAFEAGRYTASAPVATLWFVMLAVAGLTLIYAYVISPLLQLRMPFEVTQVRKIAERTWEVIIARSDGKPFVFKAGQFVWLSLASHPFSVRENPFSIASAPQDGREVGFVIKEAGDFTRSLRHVTPGRRAWIDGPHGGLVLPGPEAPGVGLIAGGVGIAPLLSVLREMHATGDPRPVVLLYGNRLESQIVYREELRRLRQSPNLDVIHVISEPDFDWRGATGMIDAANLGAAFDGYRDAEKWTYLLCGPPPMLDASEALLLARGVPANNILSERFQYDTGEASNKSGANSRSQRLWWAVSAVLGAAAIAFALRP